MKCSAISIADVYVIAAYKGDARMKRVILTSLLILVTACLYGQTKAIGFDSYRTFAEFYIAYANSDTWEHIPLTDDIDFLVHIELARQYRMYCMMFIGVYVVFVDEIAPFIAVFRRRQ